MVTKVFDAHVGLIDLVYIVAYVALQVLLALIQLLVQLKENMKIKITTDEYQLNFN